MADKLKDYLAPADAEEFASISYNKQSPAALPEFARGKAFNRYNDILPNPRTMVKLKEEGGDPSTTYINANWIRNYHGQKSFIAAQGPTPRTLPSFVRMIWEHNCCTVVMLTRLKEGPKVKCEPYFPPKLNASLQFEEISVTLLASQTKDGHTKNTLRLRRGNETKTVTHFWYTAWPDHGVPTDANNKPYTKDMILLALSVRAHRKATDKFASPAVIHCSAGVGRTGAFISVDQAIDAYKKKERIDLNDVVRQMRSDRMAMIQHPPQYLFVYAAARDYIVGKLQLKANKKQQSGESSEVESSAEPAGDPGIGAMYVAVDDYDNPDDNESVMLLERGDQLQLLEKSDQWWWMRRGTEEGWVLPDCIELSTGAAAENAEANPFNGGSGESAANPFGVDMWAFAAHDAKPSAKPQANGSKPAIAAKKPSLSAKPTVSGNKPALANGGHSRSNSNPFADKNSTPNPFSTDANPFGTTGGAGSEPPIAESGSDAAEASTPPRRASRSNSGSATSGAAYNPFGAGDAGIRSGAPNPFAGMSAISPPASSPTDHLEGMSGDVDLDSAMNPGDDDMGLGDRKESLGTFLGNSMLQAEMRIAALKAKQAADVVQEEEEEEVNGGDDGSPELSLEAPEDDSVVADVVMHSDYAVETGEEEPLPSLDEGENILPGYYSHDFVCWAYMSICMCVLYVCVCVYAATCANVRKCTANVLHTMFAVRSTRGCSRSPISLQRAWCRRCLNTQTTTWLFRQTFPRTSSRPPHKSGDLPL
eukprot:m.1348591 g.1348591  ORF g.1348591 m.1348591 type:complete len:762 (+) comp24915_c1_seq2:473-2758(+)